LADAAVSCPCLSTSLWYIFKNPYYLVLET
jgi:hypothetical protein